MMFLAHFMCGEDCALEVLRREVEFAEDVEKLTASALKVAMQLPLKPEAAKTHREEQSEPEAQPEAQPDTQEGEPEPELSPTQGVGPTCWPAPSVGGEQVPKAHPSALPLSAVACSFVVNLDKAGRMLGVALDVKTRGAQIMRLGPGAALAYNETAKPEEVLRRGDYIVEANGSKVIREMLDIMKSTDKLSLTVMRPACRTVEIIKAGRLLGCDLVFQEGQSLTVDVMNIREGAIADYNETVPEADRILEGDVICSVNGCASTCSRIVEQIQKKDRLVISLCRF